MSVVDLKRAPDDGLPDNPWRPNRLLDTANGYVEWGEGWRKRVARIIRGEHDGCRWYYTSMCAGQTPVRGPGWKWLAFADEQLTVRT